MKKEMLASQRQLDKALRRARKVFGKGKAQEIYYLLLRFCATDKEGFDTFLRSLRGESEPQSPHRPSRPSER